MMKDLASTRVALAIAMGLFVAAVGCKDGRCTSDNDCKGTRVCDNGACVESRPPISGEPGRTPGGAAPGDATHLQAVSDPNARATDGLPVEIPAAGSQPPTLPDWNAVTREVTVRGSTALNCQTKMLREWLKVRCAKKGALIPSSVSVTPPSGVQAFTFNGPDFTDLVVQVVRGRETRASFVWANAKPRELVVSWPVGAPRPTVYFAE